MTFLTNKPLTTVLPKEVMCKVSAISYDDILQTTFSGGAVVDVVGRCSAIQTLLARKNIGFFNGSLEYNAGNIIYVFLDTEKCVLKIDL